MYSPEYLAKKHGIKIDGSQPVKEISKKEKVKISLGFFNSLIIFIIFIIVSSRILYFSQDFISKSFSNDRVLFKIFF